MNPDDIRNTALSLPAEERAKLAQELLNSLEEAVDPDVEAAWMVEVERRAQELADGTVDTVDWDVARDRVARRLRDRRQ